MLDPLDLVDLLFGECNPIGEAYARWGEIGRHVVERRLGYIEPHAWYGSGFVATDEIEKGVDELLVRWAHGQPLGGPLLVLRRGAEDVGDDRPREGVPEDRGEDYRAVVIGHPSTAEG